MKLKALYNVSETVSVKIHKGHNLKSKFKTGDK